MLSHLNTLECSPFIRGSLYGIKPHLRLHLHPGTHPSTPLVTELLRSSEWTLQLLQYSDTALNLHESLHMAKKNCLSRPFRTQYLSSWPIRLPCFRSPPPAYKLGRALTPAPGSQAPQAQARTLSSTQVSLTCATCLPTAWTMTGWTPLTGFSLDTCQKKHVRLNWRY